jgi:histidyl-tRNA synthetase
MGAEYVVIVGRNELDSGKLTLRNMGSGEQESLSQEEIEMKLMKAFECN